VRGVRTRRSSEGVLWQSAESVTGGERGTHSEDRVEVVCYHDCSNVGCLHLCLLAAQQLAMIMSATACNHVVLGLVVRTCPSRRLVKHDSVPFMWYVDMFGTGNAMLCRLFSNAFTRFHPGRIKVGLD